MGGLSLTNDFNTNTDIFGGLFRMFTGGPSSGGNSIMDGIGNFLKFLFSSFASTSPETPVARNPETKQQVKRGFLDTLKDDFSAATENVRSFFRPSAFDSSKAVNKLLNDSHSAPTGQCLGSVSRALNAAGLDFNGQTLGQVMPVRGGTHYAKDLAPILASDNRFNCVADGYGASFNNGYTPQVGDIAVWTGAKYGHTQMFAGFDKQGQQVWVSDYKTNGQNWTGLRDPNSHGQFQIFRQKPADDVMVASNNTPSPRPSTLTI